MADDSIVDDTVEGAVAIAAYLGKSHRQAQHLLECKLLPAFKIGNKWHMRKSTYRRFIERLEGATARMG